MKIIVIFIAISIILTSCDPDNKDIFNLEVVKIGATLNNQNSSITLGDTIKIKLDLPNDLMSNSGTVTVQTLQEAQFYLKFRKVDTSNNTSIMLNPPLYWTSRGNISPSNLFNFIFSKNLKPFGVDINFRPLEKGIYYMEVVSQAGQIKINNVYEARLIVNFNVPDKHIELAMPFLGTAWASEAQTREFGIYVFRVN